jgi:arylsulfatase A-like enzyme
LVEKFYNAYEEFIHIPLIISNPKLHVCGQETPSLISV